MGDYLLPRKGTADTIQPNQCFVQGYVCSRGIRNIFRVQYVTKLPKVMKNTLLDMNPPSGLNQLPKKWDEEAVDSPVANKI